MSNTDAEQDAGEMRPEYGFSGGVRGKHYRAYHTARHVTIHKKDGSVEQRDFALPEGTVVLDPDVQAHFPDSEAVNRALRGILALMPRH